MDYGLLIAIPLGFVAGLGGGLLTSWSCARAVLALESTVATLRLGYDDHFAKLDQIVTRQDKTTAAQMRWSKKSADEEALAATLKNGATPVPFVLPHGW